MRRLLGAVVVLAACGGTPKSTGNTGIADGIYSPNDVTLIAPSSALGTISGQILDGTGTPLQGATAKATLPSGVASATTDQNGAFSFAKVPGGTTVDVVLSKSGYTTGYATVTVPDNAGNVPEENTNAFVGPITLFDTGSSLTVSVVGYDGSLLAANAIAVISPGYGTRSADGSSAVWSGSTTLSATSAMGTMTFSGVPDLEQLAALGSTVGAISVVLAPSMNNSTSYGGATLYVTVAEALSTPGVLSMVAPDTSQGAPALAIVGSGVGSLVNGPGSPTDSLVNPSNPVSVAFNQPVDPTSIGVTLVSNDGSSEQATVMAMAPNVITFADPSGSFLPQTGYSVTVLAAASNDHPETQKAFTGTMFTVPNEAGPTLVTASFTPDATSSGLLEPGDTVSVALDSPVGLADQAPVLAAYIDANISSQAGSALTLVGEFGSPAGGWLLTPDPTYPLIGGTPGVTGSGFSSHFRFTYSGTGITALTPGSTHPVTVLFADPATAGCTPLSWLNGLPLSVATSPGSNGEKALTSVQ